MGARRWLYFLYVCWLNISMVALGVYFKAKIVLLSTHWCSAPHGKMGLLCFASTHTYTPTNSREMFLDVHPPITWQTARIGDGLTGQWVEIFGAQVNTMVEAVDCDVGKI